MALLCLNGPGSVCLMSPVSFHTLCNATVDYYNPFTFINARALNAPFFNGYIIIVFNLLIKLYTQRKK